MNLELIPIIEISYYDPAITSPEKGPYWEYPKAWDEYRMNCHAKAGFKDFMTPYLSGCAFYKLEENSDDNLAKLVIDQTKEMRDDNYYREQGLPFYGGYVLKIDNQDVYFPQCCGDLSDINCWEKLLINDKPFYSQGHPEPHIEIKNETIVFDFNIGEHFAPPPKQDKIVFEKSALEKVKVQLDLLAKRIQNINLTQQLNIENIDKLLIWGDNQT